MEKMSMRSLSIAESTPASARPPSDLAVSINVYYLRTMQRSNCCMHPCGIGVYHTAIQIGKREVTFGGNTESQQSGIYTNQAMHNENFIYRFSIPVYAVDNPQLPVLVKTEQEIYYEVIPKMGLRYTANTYDILLKNCNHFTEEFLGEITGGRFGLPSYINRAARIGAYFHCLVPQRYLSVPPRGAGVANSDSSDRTTSNALANYSGSPHESTQSLLVHHQNTIRSERQIIKKGEQPSPAVMARAARLLGGYYEGIDSDLSNSESPQGSIEAPEYKLNNTVVPGGQLDRAKTAREKGMCAEEHRVGSHDLSLTTSDEYSKSFEAKRGVKSMRLGEKINPKTETTHKSAYVDELDEAEVTTPTEFSTAREARLYHGRGYQRTWTRPEQAEERLK